MYEAGCVYNRRLDIHGRLGGQAQGGISTPKETPYVILFTGESGPRYGYEDRWDEEGVYHYTSEGQKGDMDFVRGNRAIRDHARDGKELLLFQTLPKRAGCRFLGAFACGSWEYRRGPDVDGNERRVIVFGLIETNVEAPAGPEEADHRPEGLDPGSALEDLKATAYSAAGPVQGGQPKTTRRRYFERRLAVRQYVLARALGRWEACEEPAPFVQKDGTPYLEPHHTKMVSEGGPDHPRWVAAVCPNCHREIHFGAEGAGINHLLAEYLATAEGNGD